jgi:hypothetical protein
MESCSCKLRQIGSHDLRSGKSQIGQLTTGVATTMARILRFHDVGVYTYSLHTRTRYWYFQCQLLRRPVGPP